MAKMESGEILLVDGRDVRVSNPDKPYFSRDVKLSKLDVVQYYLSVASGAVAGAVGYVCWRKRGPKRRRVRISLCPAPSIDRP